MSEATHASAKLLHHLLTNHHCVNSVAIVTSILCDHQQLICDALSKSLSLRKLKLCALRTAAQWPRNIATALLHLEHLRDLELHNVLFERTFIECLSEFLTNTRLLTTLTVTHQNLQHEDHAIAFLDGLRRNQTITTLSFDIRLPGALPFGIMFESRFSPRSAVVFAGYLRNNKTLHTLILRGGPYLTRFTEVSRPIVEALVKNNALKKLSLRLVVAAGRGLQAHRVAAQPEQHPDELQHDRMQ
ncbi:hypothetical protein MTO96_040218 [Rhipicephalus appendiculatus]